MKRSTLLFTAGLCLLGLSCTTQSLQSVYDAQEKKIDSFVSARISAGALRSTYNGGSVRVVLSEGFSADSLAADGVVSFYYAGYTLNGTSTSKNYLFATNRKEEAEAAGWALSDTTGFGLETLVLDDGELVEGLRNGLEGVRSGEECYILFSGKYGFGKRALGTIPARSALVYHIWVESITNE